jgi:hypothetical protein
MQQKKRNIFYFFWHLSSGMIIAYGLGLSLAYAVCEFYGYDLRCVTQGDFIFFLMPVSCVLGLVSFLIHRLVRGWNRMMSDWSLTRTISYSSSARIKSDWSLVWRILLICIGLLAIRSPMLFILIPLLVECLLLLALDRFWDSRLGEKAKRKNNNMED